MNGKYSFSSRGNCFLNLINVNGQGLRIYIHENRRCSRKRDGSRGRCKGMSRQNHFMSGPNPKRPKAQLKSGESVIHTYCVLHSAVCCKFFFELSHILPEDKIAPVQYT